MVKKQFVRGVFLQVVLVALLTVLSLPALAAGGLDNAVRIDILTVNDFHGALLEDGKTPGAAKLAGFIEKERALNPKGTLVLSAGDMFQGTVRSNILYGKPVVQMMNAVGFTAMALGNHEFDWGLEPLQERAKEARFPFLAANIMYKGINKFVDFARPYTIVEANGIKVGIIGVITPATAYTTNMAVATKFSFEDPLVTVRRLAPLLKEQGAQVIVVLGHIDSEMKDGKISGEAADLALKLKPRPRTFPGPGPVLTPVPNQITKAEGEQIRPIGHGPAISPDKEGYDAEEKEPKSDKRIVMRIVTPVDAIVSAHSHMKVAGKVAGIPIVQAGYSGRSLGKISIFYSPADKRIVSSETKVLDIIPAETPTDAKVKKIVDRSAKQAAPVEKTVLGQALADISHDRHTLSLLGEFVSDAIRQAAGADIAFQNGGGLRKPLVKGNITLGNLYEVLPFDNTIVTVDLTGRQIIDILNYGIYNKNIGMVQFSGLRIEYDPLLPQQERVAAVTLADGSLLLPDKLYKVATNDFMADGGDGFTMFKEGKNFYNTNIVLRDTVAEAVKKAGKVEVKDDGRFKEQTGVARNAA